ncbi:transcriptional regulator, TetR family [Pseudomonas sp. NFACC15-1]|uniref:TetR/AcrR family transcriptional regulator n=1 Tax=Pseudomonas TaxID=286 RepID=UPI000871B158|nr:MULTISPECIES: TetR/AcrR family transcriptional regulator [unclassified Pseudomonas]SCW99102.1 transcriptional regulator, TetR family [Pseudomonas sp. NFACC56-3]SDA50850.1 transcriptional regulator, TetR family [Pseudomonas sp. NFACC15-1]SDW83354.1 transcriptional regulator, TetR family [Pseudomonas sp. NFACC14]SFK87953.1 transcriptional regulator, TetR family [Pseudomonas sp. NFACC52]
MGLDPIKDYPQTQQNVAAPRLSIREEQKLRTRDRLLDAAFEVFSAVGYRAATIDEIMKRAGANRATFYLHFSDKLDIAAGIGRRSSMAVSDRFRQLDKMVEPSKADIRVWLENDLNHRRSEKVMVDIIHEASSADPRFGQEYLDYFVRIAERVMVNTVARWPEDQRPMARMKIVCLFVMLHRLEFHLLCQELDFGTYDPIDALANLLWNELFAPLPPQ